MNERRNVAASGAIAVLSVLAGTLAVRQWLAGLFSDVGPDRAADMVLLAGIGACAGVGLLGLAFTFVLLLVRARQDRQDVIDVQARPMLPAPAAVAQARFDEPMIEVGQTFIPRSTARSDAERMVSELRPMGIDPTEAAARQYLGITSSRRVQAAWSVLQDYELIARDGQGSPVKWRRPDSSSPGEEEATKRLRSVNIR